MEAITELVSQEGSILNCEDLLEKKVESNTVFEGKMVNVRVDQVQLPSGNITVREVVEHPGSVGVIPIDNDGKIILIRQFRYSVGEILWEIPAGKLDPGESDRLPSVNLRKKHRMSAILKNSFVLCVVAFPMRYYICSGD